MIRDIIFSFFIICLSYSISAQNTITGQVVDDKEQPIPFVNILLTPLNDTTKIETGSISDLEGNFQLDIKSCKKELYFIFVSCLGYKTVKDTLPIEALSDDMEIIIEMQPSFVNLEGVTVEVKTVTQDIDKVTYSVSPLDRHRALSSLSLLSIVPTLKINEATNTVTTQFDRSVKLLLNGRNSTDKEIMAINHSQIIRIEHYRFPPARFAHEGYAAVVNVITRNAVEGGTVSIDMSNSPNVSYGDDQIYGNYNKGKSQVSGRYYFSYRDYKNKEIYSRKEYGFNDQLFTDQLQSKKFPFGYRIHEGNITYTNQDIENYIFSIDFKPKFVKSYDYPSYNFTEINNEINQTGYGERSSLIVEQTIFTDVYFQKKIGKVNEIFVNLVGTYFDTETDFYDVCLLTSNDTLLYDYLNNYNTRLSLISEVQHAISLENVKINTGVRSTIGKLDQIINNSAGEGKYNLNTNDFYGYTEIIGKLKNLSYQGGLGVSYSEFNSVELSSSYSYFKLVPRIQLGIPFKDFYFRGHYQLSTTNPSLSDLNIHRSYGRNYLVSEGNPNLKPFKTHDISLAIDYKHRHIASGIEFQYSQSDQPILWRYKRIGEFLSFRPNNEEWRKESAISSYLNFKFFEKDKVVLSLYGSIYKYENKYLVIPEISILGYSTNITLNFNHNDLTFSCTYANGLKDLRGQSVLTRPDYSSFFAFYRHKEFTFGIGIMFPFSESYKTKYETVDGSIVQENKMVDIFDSSRILTFRLRYNFQFGRSFNWNRELRNTDNESGVIRTH